MSGKKSRTKGHAFERWAAAQFREYSFPDCKTSRQADPLADPRGIDLTSTFPYAVQCKAVEQLGSHHRILNEMEPMSDEIPVLFHKRKGQGVVVTLWAEDFLAMAEKLKNSVDL